MTATTNPVLAPPSNLSKAHLTYLSELSSKAAESRKEYASAYSAYLEANRRLGTDFQEQSAKAYQEYVDSLSNAWSVPDVAEKCKQHYEAYLTILSELTYPDLPNRLSEQEQAYSRLLQEIQTAPQTEAYQNYTKQLDQIWDQSDKLRRLREEGEAYVKTLGELTSRAQQQVKEATDRYLARLREVSDQIDLPKSAEKHFSEFSEKARNIWEDVFKFNRDALNRTTERIRATAQSPSVP